MFPTGCEPSDELVTWAREAKYACTPRDSTGASVFWSEPGGEIRFFIRRSGDEFTLSRAERASAESFVLSASELVPIERLLFDTFGAEIRAARRLPWLKVPTKREELASGYHLVELRDGLIDLRIEGGKVIARARDGRIGVMNLVVMSYLYSASIDDIQRTYLNASGTPIFPQANNE